MSECVEKIAHCARKGRPEFATTVGEQDRKKFHNLCDSAVLILDGKTSIFFCVDSISCIEKLRAAYIMVKNRRALDDATNQEVDPTALL